MYYVLGLLGSLALLCTMYYVLGLCTMYYVLGLKGPQALLSLLYVGRRLLEEAIPLW